MEAMKKNVTSFPSHILCMYRLPWACFSVAAGFLETSTTYILNQIWPVCDFLIAKHVGSLVLGSSSMCMACKHLALLATPGRVLFDIILLPLWRKRLYNLLVVGAGLWAQTNVYKVS